MTNIRLRPEAEIKTSFEKITKELDARLEEVRQAGELSGFETKDHSNRSGFEHSGYPYFLWSHRVSFDFHHGGSLALASLLIEYLEPIELEEQPRVQIRQKAELYNRGQASFFIEEKEAKYSLTDFLALNTVEFVSAGLQEAKQKILNQPAV